MKKSIFHVSGILFSVFLGLMIGHPVYAYASDGEAYITISVDAEDDNETLLYALDTDDPSAFSTSNEFTVPAGTDHTIYVKDAAGNITSQDFKSSSTDYDQAYMQGEDDNGRTVNIDVVLDDTPDYSDYEYAGDLLKDPAESGQGTVYDKVNTDANDPDAQRIFYTVTTDEGEVFYLVIDQGQSSNNVYLLDQVNLSDLHALAVDDKSSSSSEESESLLSSLNKSNESEELLTEKSDTQEKQDKKSSNNIRLILILAIAVVGGGVYYYQNIYKKKKDEQMDLVDALDRDDFAAEEDEEEEDADFGLDEDYQEKTMAMLLDDDEVSDFMDVEDDEIGNTEIMQEDDTDEDADSEEDESIYATSHNDNLVEQVNDEDFYDDDLDAPDEEDEE